MLGRSSNESFDYNDLVVGTHFLYLTTRVIKFQGSDYEVLAVVLMRIRLDDLAACRPAHYDFVIRTDIGEGEFGELRVLQGITNIAYAGATYPKGGQGHILRVLVWPEKSKVVTTIDRPVPPFVFMYSGDTEPNCASEDGVVPNWCVINPGLFAARGGGYIWFIWFAWDVQQYGEQRPFPYTRITQLRERDLALVSSRDLYGLTVAHSLAADRRGHLAVVDSFGGGKGDRHYFPGSMIGIFDDILAPPVVDFFLFGRSVGCNTAGPGATFDGAWGDFNTIRNWQGANGLWLATTYVSNDNVVAECPDLGANVTIKNIVFGRELDRVKYDLIEASVTSNHPITGNVDR